MKELKEKETQTARKLRGGYYTPYPIAEYLWKYVKENNPKQVLEPAAGDGALLKPIDNSDINIDAIEYQDSEAEKINKNINIPQVKVYVTEFFLNGLMIIKFKNMMQYYPTHHISVINI